MAVQVANLFDQWISLPYKPRTYYMIHYHDIFKSWFDELALQLGG